MDTHTQFSTAGFERQNLLTSAEAAQLIGVANVTMKKSRCSGTLLGKPAPKFMKMGRVVRYEFSAIQWWLTQYRAFSTTGEAVANGY